VKRKFSRAFQERRSWSQRKPPWSEKWIEYTFKQEDREREEKGEELKGTEQNKQVFWKGLW
jgi:hypothetical protein